jgi:glycosyltransferase involved in cell wall biosynthesis
MDGGSTDGSIDIIHKYEKYIAHWTSHLDGGQAAALRAGFGRATGAILAWINSDDVYLPSV